MIFRVVLGVLIAAALAGTLWYTGLVTPVTCTLADPSECPDVGWDGVRWTGETATLRGVHFRKPLPRFLEAVPAEVARRAEWSAVVDTWWDELRGAVCWTGPDQRVTCHYIDSTLDLGVPRLPIYATNPAGDGGVLTGQLVPGKNGNCLYLEAHGDRWLAIWPSPPRGVQVTAVGADIWPFPGTGWDGTAVSMGNSVVVIGDLAVFGGGETVFGPAELESTDLVRPPSQRCLVEKAWWVTSVDSPP